MRLRLDPWQLLVAASSAFLAALVASIGVVEAFRQAQIESSATFNFTPYLGTALLFVLVTIPLARFTDWLIARDRRRRQAGSVR